jgi:multidrug efflux pump subunit AcrA (membrane-fusion protein)
VFTDAGGAGLPGKVSYIASKAEFTPRNVQTAEDRSKLVYRVKIAVDNTNGVLKQGMPVEADIPFSNRHQGLGIQTCPLSSSMRSERNMTRSWRCAICRWR